MRKLMRCFARLRVSGARVVLALAAMVLAAMLPVVSLAGAASGQGATVLPGWPQLHYGPARTGYQPHETKIGTGNVHSLRKARTYQTNGSPTPPLIANGILYVATNKLYAFDATGATHCSAAPKTCTPLWTAPAAYVDGMTVADGDVFVTEGQGIGVQAFDAAGSKGCSGSPKVCAPLWTTSHYTSTGPSFQPGSGSPVVVDGVLYVPGYGDGLALSSGGAYVAAFDAAGSTDCSGSPRVCAPMWTTTGPPSGAGNDGSPAIVNGVVYIADGKLFAFPAGSTNCSGTPKVCRPLWTAVTSSYGPPFPAPAVANGTVYVGSWGGKLYAFDAAGSKRCSTTATAKTTCKPLWTAAIPGGIGGTPAVANNVIYTVSGDGTLSAFDAAGSKRCSTTASAKTCKPLWTSAAGGSGYVTFSSPAVANGVVYFSSTNGGTYGYDAAGSKDCSGSPKVCAPLWGAVSGFIGGGSPAVVNGVLFINVSGNGKIYAYDLPATAGTRSRSPARNSWPARG